MSIESVTPSSHLILCRPLLLLPPIPPSIRVFSNESVLAWGSRSIGVSASASVLPVNTQDWSPLGWTGWISLQSKELSRVFSNTTVQKHRFFSAQLSSQSNSHIHTWPLGKTIALTRQTFVSKAMSLLFNMLSGMVITFLPRKCLSISWLQSPSAVVLEPLQNKVWHCFHCFPIYLHEVMGPDAVIFVFWMLSFKPAFSFYSFTLLKGLFISSSLSAIRVVSIAYLRLLIFLPAILMPACASSNPAFEWCALHRS